MKYLIVLSAFLLACQNIEKIPSPQKIIPIDVTTEIQLQNDRFMLAYNNHDAKKVATEIFSSNAVIYAPNSSPVKGGVEVLEGFWKAVMESGVHKAEIKTEKATSYGDMALDVGKVMLFDKDNNLIDDAKYMVEWTKENGQWKITKDIWNSNNP